MADIDLTKAADSVRKLKVFTDAVTQVGAFVEDLTLAQNLTSEIRLRLEQAKTDEAQAQERLGKLADAIGLAEADIKRSQAKAVEIEQAAQRTASTILANAKREAEQTVTEAQAEAERIKGPLNAALRALNVDIEAAKSDLSGLVDARTAAQADLDTLNQQIADARAAIATLLKV